MLQLEYDRSKYTDWKLYRYIFKYYKLENLDKQNPDYSKSNIRLTEDKQDVLNCLNKKIDAIKNYTSTTNVIKRLIVQGIAGSAKKAR